MADRVYAGQDAEGPRPGDFILCHRKGIVPAIIRWGERIRFRPGDRWSHAALIETPGTVIEALARGVCRTPLSAYRDVEYVLVRTGLRGEDRDQAVAFAQACLGEEYGWLTIAGIALRFLTPGRGLWFGMSGTAICSGLVAQAQVRGWVVFAQDPSSITPAELGEHYNT